MTQAVRLQPSPKAAPPRWRLGAAFGLVLAFGMLIAAGYLGQIVFGSDRHPVRKVTVEGNFRYLTPTYIQTLVGRELQGGFFQLDVEALRRQILEEPWVFDAAIERVWPDAIRVAITEQAPAARWGEHALLNTAADIFAPPPASFPPGLPRLSGPVGTENDVLSRYRQAQQAVRELGLRVASVDLSERGAWSLTFDDGTRLVFGRREVEARLAKFVAVYAPLLKHDWAGIATIDLRYTNGFAVEMRLASATPDAGPAKRG
jgi:cell division protein FtsQ